MLKPTAPGSLGDFHARLEHLDKDLWRAVFTGELNPTIPAAGQEWPDSHLGGDPDGLRAWVENMARSMGYHRVVWDT